MLDCMRGWATLHVVLPSLHNRPSIGANALHTIDTTINLLIWAALATPFQHSGEAISLADI